MSIFGKEKNNVPDAVSPSTDTSASHTPILTEEEIKEEHPLTEIIRFALIALIIVLPIRWFVAQPFIVSGSSMVNTFHNGEYLIVDQLSYYFEDPKHGDVIIFRYPQDPSKFFIKRVIAVPGDKLTIEGNVVTIKNDTHPDGIVLNETYVDEMTPNTHIDETMRENEYFVMGDNRDASSDSRTWGILTRDKIVGRAFLRLFPFTEISIFPGAYDGTAISEESIANNN